MTTDLWYNTRRAAVLRPGQTALEYVLSLAALMVVAVILWGLVGVVLRHADRTEDLVSSECP